MSSEERIIDVTFRHPLLGTWIDPTDEFSVEYTVSVIGDVCEVSGIDSDGEQFDISEVAWDGVELRFTSLMPSTHWDLRHVFRVVSDQEVEHEWTRVERWIKKAQDSRPAN